MIASQFADLSKRIFPKLQNIVEKERGERNGAKKRTYLHKTMLRKVYSADQKWTSASVDTTYVRADTVSMNSPLPIKKRDSLAHASGTLPKQGISRVMEESDINTINIMKAQGAKWTQIASKLTEDPLFCSIGLDESNEANFLTALCEGVVAVEDLTNVGTALRVNFGYLPKNGFGVTTPGEITLDDIERVLAAADGDGNSISVICIALSTYKKLRQTQGAKELAATYRGQIFDSDTSLPTPTSSLFDEAFADQYNGVRFLKIDRSIIYEKNGVRKAYKPWNANRLVYLTTENVGSLVWGTLAEKTSPVEGVVYTTVDEMKLISRFRTANPLVETTAGQMLALTVIEGVDQIYYQDITDAQTVDAEKEAQDSTDVKVTIWGDTYKKTEFVQELNKITGGKLTAKSADEKIIARVNELNDEDEATLKATVESHKSEYCMKTVLQALKDEVHYKLSSGFFENRLLERSLDGNEICTIDILKSKPFKGAVADCLMSLIQMPNFTEGDVSLSLSDKDNILTLANGIYNSIGETEKNIGEPIVYIGK